MTLEEYKQRIKECLLIGRGESEAERLYKQYEKDIPNFYEECWTAEGATAGIVMGYYPDQKEEGKISLEEYKLEVKECLRKAVGENRTERLLKLYDDEDLKRYLQEGWSPAGAATAMCMGD